MKLQDKIIFFFLVLLVILPVVYTNLEKWEITSTDWTYRHTLWIQSYIEGKWIAILEYQPLFHWLMLPFVYFNFPMVIFQIIFSILNLSMILWYFYKEHYDESIIYVTLFMASSIIYMQVSSALMPQALDLLFFLPILYFYFKKKYKWSFAILGFLFLTHVTALIYSFILIIHSIMYKRYRFALGIVLIILLFSPLYYFYFFPEGIEGKIIPNLVPATRENIMHQLEYEEWFYTPFWKFFVTSGILSWLYLPFALNNLRKRKFYLSEKQILYLIWIVAFIPLMFYIPFELIFKGLYLWRALTFIIIPFFFFTATLLGEKNEIEEAFVKHFGK